MFRKAYSERILLLSFLVSRLLLAPLTPLGELYFSLYLLLVLAAPIVDALALAAGELDESILRHSEEDYSGNTLSGQSRSYGITVTISGSAPPKETLRLKGSLGLAESQAGVPSGLNPR